MNPKKISVGITAFVDILGFGNRVIAANNVEDIEEIERCVNIIRDAFDHETDNDLYAEAQKIMKKTVLAFSDCVIINTPLESKATKYSGTFDPIVSEIAGMAYAQAECVLKNLFIRGGVDIGWWYKNKSTLISSSLTRAYKMEGGARFPVIALTNELIEHFSSHEDRKFYAPDIDPIRTLFRTTRVDEVEIHYIDYIRINVEALGWQTSKEQMNEYRNSSGKLRDAIVNEGYKSNVEQWLHAHANNVLGAYQAAPEKDKAKYIWLAEYHNEIARQFTGSTKCMCDLKAH